MARDGNTYSRVIGWLKVALPLAALAILSTVFLVSNQVEVTTAIPYSSAEIEDRLREPRMTAATYSGVTRDGAALTIKADTARPDASGGGQAAALTGLLETPDGQKTDLTAADGTVDSETRLVHLTGDVVVTTSTGYRVSGDSFTAAMDETHVESQAPVAADGPPGRITADQMVLRADAAAEGSYVLVFNGAVKLVYQPQR